MHIYRIQDIKVMDSLASSELSVEDTQKQCRVRQLHRQGSLPCKKPVDINQT